MIKKVLSALLAWRLRLRERTYIGGMLKYD
jgi:hypothetical protein